MTLLDLQAELDELVDFTPVSADARRLIEDGTTSFVHPTYVVDGDETLEGGWVSSLRETSGTEKAQLVSSEIKGLTGYHSIMLDLDVPATLVPSSTPGHSHLYVDIALPWDSLERVLVALAEAGVIQRGYADASLARKHTTLRLPWVAKHDNDGLGGSE